MSKVLNSMSRLTKLIRSAEWWDYKIPLALAAAYALAWRLAIPFQGLWLRLILLICSGTICGVYASIFNDFMDIDEDRAAGKVTEMMKLSQGFRMAILVATLFSMLLMATILSWNRLYCSLGCFLVIFIVYTFYSLPPIRLKTRGVWGIASIAVGEHFLAAALAVCLVVEGSGKGLPVVWFAWLGLWSLSLGCRSILWHQLCDYKNDRKSGTRTLGAVHGPEALKRLGERYVFPVEIVSLGAWLLLSHNMLAWLLLLVYGLVEVLRMRYLDSGSIVVSPTGDSRFVLFEYYQLFLPLSFIIAEGGRNPFILLLILAQLSLFPGTWRNLANHLMHVMRWRFHPWLHNQLQIVVKLSRSIVEHACSCAERARVAWTRENLMLKEYDHCPFCGSRSE